GRDRGDAVGHALDEVFERPFVEALRAARRENPGGATLFRMPLANGSAERLLVNVTIVPLQSSAGHAALPVDVPEGTIILFEDISARVRLEEQLQISEKMASI